MFVLIEIISHQNLFFCCMPLGLTRIIKSLLKTIMEISFHQVLLLQAAVSSARIHPCEVWLE